MGRAEFWASLRPKLGAAILLLGIFVAGAFTGAAIYRSASMNQHKPPFGPHHVLDMFTDHFSLTDEQRMRVASVLEKYRPEFEAVMQETFPRLSALQDQVDAEVRPILTPEQLSRFDAFKLKTRPFGARSRGVFPKATQPPTSGEPAGTQAAPP